MGSVNSANAASDDDHPVPVHFTSPGADHRARWMAKGIYCLKIYLFREQFRLTTQEGAALRRICFNCSLLRSMSRPGLVQQVAVMHLGTISAHSIKNRPFMPPR